MATSQDEGWQAHKCPCWGCWVRNEGRGAGEGSAEVSLKAVSEYCFHCWTQLNRLFFHKHSSLSLHRARNPKVGPLSARPSHQPVPVAMVTIWGKVISLLATSLAFSTNQSKPPTPSLRGRS